MRPSRALARQSLDSSAIWWWMKLRTPSASGRTFSGEKAWMNSASLPSICAVAWWRTNGGEHERTGAIRWDRGKEAKMVRMESGRSSDTKFNFFRRPRGMWQKVQEAISFAAQTLWLCWFTLTSTQCHFFPFDWCESEPKELSPRMNSKL